MPYLIDGHNLIPKIPDISLDAIDDEMQLVERLQEFCRRSRKKAEVFFDNAPPDGLRARNFGHVTAHFVRQGSTADDAIHHKLRRLKGEARNWIVVSSDRAVQAAARAAQARVMPSDTFARLIAQSLDASTNDRGADHDPKLSADEVEDWLDLFNSNQKKLDQ
jgi:predicted RNA-binding protein with PIN domain